MRNRKQFNAVNIDLSQDYTTYDRLLSSGDDYYFVFWWKDIPLGDLYYSNQDHKTEIQRKSLVYNAIKESVRWYIQKYLVQSNKFETVNFVECLDIIKELEDIFKKAEHSLNQATVDLSVVICTRNRSAHLKECLETLARQTFVPREIIVVDNAPSDNSTRSTVEKFPGVKYILEAQPGLDIARNTGARFSKSSIVAYTDDDVLLTENWCYEVWQTFQDENVHAMTGLIIASTLQTESQVIFEKHWSFNRGYIDILFDKRFLKTAAPRVWDIGAGANMAFRRVALEKVNYFDERLDAGAAGCSGDSEIWFRILSADLSIFYNPRAVVFHTHRSSMSSLKKQIYYYMRGHAASLMIQHAHNNQCGYLRYLSRELPKYYFWLLREGFPFYGGRHATLIEEMTGIISGIKYYYKNKTRKISLNDKTA
jgi:glycosyltransferase involved in cell wall biosynthesis